MKPHTCGYFGLINRPIKVDLQVGSNNYKNGSVSRLGGVLTIWGCLNYLVTLALVVSQLTVMFELNHRNYYVANFYRSLLRIRK